MLNSNEYLELCSKLSEAGLLIEPKTGLRVARGFADLGYEEFYLLPANKLLSIYTAKISDWLAEHQQFFFTVPDADQLVAAIESLEIIVDIQRNDQEWQVSLKQKDQVVEGSGRSLNMLLVKLYLELSL